MDQVIRIISSGANGESITIKRNADAKLIPREAVVRKEICLLAPCTIVCSAVDIDPLDPENPHRSANRNGVAVDREALDGDCWTMIDRPFVLPLIGGRVMLIHAELIGSWAVLSCVGLCDEISHAVIGIGPDAENVQTLIPDIEIPIQRPIMGSGAGDLDLSKHRHAGTGQDQIHTSELMEPMTNLSEHLISS